MTDHLRDRLEIGDLFNRYAFALDQRRWDWLEEIFTEDAKCIFPGDFEASGRKNLIEMIVHFMDLCAATHHLVANNYAVIDGDEAEAVCYMRAHHAQKGGTGVFEESLAVFTGQAVRTPSGWRFRSIREQIPIALGDFAALSTAAPPGVVLSGSVVSPRTS